MIPEPDTGFRKRVAQRFRLRCLSDFFGAGDTWPSCNVFVDTYVDYTLQSPTVYTQAVILERLYKELTQVVRRVCPTRTHLARPCRCPYTLVLLPRLGRS
ncbi:uncharacterized protein PHALS_04711 [Plasmopara halstedii]|uniref:Uncharacterized protein n=1 Tax=Plasmopara halstedii TaxID=4781 RepID=A0A0P1A941_PLAHL|nr:uncharacterized protein PHALS_04711 [Plasmopara halstedii]CEG37272.1 hypothetical protein PHALS_04711 [Plasmopara halstedii]|eukprot:XP_024573641.1 hypothetical protein PHALS_04711 [Plasmopara halstedii]